MTAAPYPADTRAKGWRFEIDVERIEQSDTWTLAPSAIRPWLLMLWMTAWKQTPCGTLTNDDTLIAARIGMSAKEFTKHRSILMRGWWLADDGRLYHVALTERVEAMLEKRTKDTSRKSLFDAKSKLIRERDGGACVYCNARTYLSLDHLIAMSRGGSGEESNLVTACRRCNSVKGARNPDEAGMTFVNPAAERLWHAARAEQSESVTRYQNGVTRDERVSDDTKHQAPSTSNQKTEPVGSVPARKARGQRRCPETFEVSAEMREWARASAPSANVERETMKFRNHEFAKARSDWLATWQNWILKADENAAALPQGRPPPESFRAQEHRIAAERVAEASPRIARRMNPNPTFDYVDMETPHVPRLA